MERPSKDTDRLMIRFGKSTIYYSEEFAVIIDGALWPRQLKAVNHIIDIYKECSRLDLKGVEGE